MKCRKLSLNYPCHTFLCQALHSVSEDVLRKRPIEVLQLNIGLYCNQACNHCHVESSPRRHEMMDRQTAEKCSEVLKNSPSITTVDITGEMSTLEPH